MNQFDGQGNVFLLRVVVLLVVTTIMTGCEPKKPVPKTVGTQPETTSSTSIEGGASVPHGRPEPLLADWKDPKAVFFLTGETHGYMEPCGCTVNQSGGVARRADFFRMLTEERKWPVIGLDVGGTARRNRRQDQIKFISIIEALRQMNYAAVAVGLEEMRFGADFLLQMQVADPEEAKKSVALLSANVTLYDPPLEGWPLAYRMIDVGGVKVGVTAITGTSLREEVAPSGGMSNITIKDPGESLPAVIESMKAEKPEFLILLSHGKFEEAKALAEKYPEFRIVLAAGGPEEPDRKPVAVGSTWLIQAGHKGKRIGVLGYFPQNQEQPFQYDLVELDQTRFKNAPAMRQLMKTYQQQLVDESISLSDELIIKHPSGHSFVGSAKCGECHTKAYEHWKTTPHAHAYNSLITGRHGDDPNDPISRINDPECLSCHVTGWEAQQMLRYESGFVSATATPFLLDNGCENCHGPGSLHASLQEMFANDPASVAMEKLVEGQKSVHRTVEAARNGDCAKCHDSDNSPKFTPQAFDDNWKRIAHPWRD